MKKKPGPKPWKKYRRYGTRTGSLVRMYSKRALAEIVRRADSRAGRWP